MSEGENNSIPEREEIEDSPGKDIKSEETNNVVSDENKPEPESEDVEMKNVEEDKTRDDDTAQSPRKSHKRKKEPKEEKSEDVDKDKTDSSSPSRSPVKTHQKKEKVEDEDDDEDSDEEPRVGLLEQPVVLEAGQKRERKKVERIEIVGSASQKDKTIEIPEGSGEKLGDIPRVEFRLNKTTADDLKPFHRILYNRFGSITEVKRNIRKFCGFTFKTNDAEYEKKKQHLNKLTLTVLKSFCELLDLERKGTKEDIVNRIMTFLLKPASSGKALPKPKRKRSSTGGKGSKRKTKSKAKAEKKKVSRSPKKKRAKSKEEVDEESDQEDEDEQKESEAESEQNEDENEEQKSEEERSEEESDEEEEAPKKKKQKKETPKRTPAKKEAKKPVKKETKKAATKKAAAKTKKKAVESDSHEEASSDDEPLVTKKKPPTDDELRDVIKKILDHADLQEVTMKTVCKQVYDKYPDFDLVPRKDFIKTTVKQIIR